MIHVREKLPWALVAALGLLLLAALAGVVRSGPLDPPGAPGPTQPQVEPRSPIPPVGWNGTFPIVINQAGSYFLTRDLTGVAGADGIDIHSSGVTLDLNGFTLRGVASSGDGISSHCLSGGNPCVYEGVVEVKNGQVQAWGGDGVDLLSARGSTVTGVVAVYNGGDGISTNPGGGADIVNQVQDCISMGNGGTGIRVVGSVISNCHVRGNGTGISGFAISVLDSEVRGNLGPGIVVTGHSLVSRNIVSANGPGDGIYVDGTGNRVENNSVAQNSSSGISVWFNGNSITGNNVEFNGTVGIYVVGQRNRLDENHAADNDWGFMILGSNNVAVRNSATGNITGGYDVGVGNDVAVRAAANTSPNAWANISD